MSSSRHPIALALEQHVGGSVRLLATVMALPLIDGIFAALVLAGALSSVLGIVQIGLLVFGGSATLAVVMADMDGGPRENAIAVLTVGVPLMALAAVEAALAPTIAGLLDLVMFERFAGLVLISVAAKTASARVGEYLPRPAAVIALGLVASVDLSGTAIVATPDLVLVTHAAAAAGVGVAFALTVAVFQVPLRRLLDIDRFRFGSAVALGTLACSVVGLLPSSTPLPLIVLALALLLAFDPDAAETQEDTAATDTERLPWM